MMKLELLEKVETLALLDKDGTVLMQEEFKDLESSSTQVVLLQEVEDDEIVILAWASDWGMMRIAKSMVMKVAEQTGMPFPFLVSRLMGPILRRGEDYEG